MLPVAHRQWLHWGLTLSGTCVSSKRQCHHRDLFNDSLPLCFRSCSASLVLYLTFLQMHISCTPSCAVSEHFSPTSIITSQKFSLNDWDHALRFVTHPPLLDNESISLLMSSSSLTLIRSYVHTLLQ